MGDSAAEKNVRKILDHSEFTYENKRYKIITNEKPKPEPKTDFYILAKNLSDNSEKEFKISYKKIKHSFVENKIKPHRIKNVFGKQWSEILQKQMATRKKGHIAIVSSPAGYRGLPTAGAYGMTKAGLINLAESLYFDFKKHGIRISVINPGFIESTSTNQNSFPMPFIKPASFAAEKIFDGLTKTKKFEINFPFFFLRMLKLARMLPYPIYFYLINKITGL